MERRLAIGHKSGDADRGNRWKPEIALCRGIAVGGIRVEALADEFRAVAQGLLDEGGEVGRGSGWKRLIRQIKGALIGIAQRGGELREGRLQIILSLDQQELGLREVHVGEADVQPRFDFVLRQRGDLVGDKLALVDRLLGHGENGLRLQHGEVGLIGLKQDVGAGGDDVFFFGLGMEAGALDEFVCAAKIGDELIHGDAISVAIEDDGIVQTARGDAAVGLGVGSGKAAVGEGIIRGAGLRDLRLSRDSQMRGGLNLWMILDGDFFGVEQGEVLGGLRRGVGRGKDGENREDEDTGRDAHGASSGTAAAWDSSRRE